MKEKLSIYLLKAAQKSGVESDIMSLEYTENSSNGDFSSNVAMVYAKKLGTTPRELAEKIIEVFKSDMPDFVIAVEVAGPGFINFFIKDEAFVEEIFRPGVQVNAKSLQRVLVEHTDPNTFKPFHIGHLMANAIGESLARLIIFSGDNVTKLCYPSDIGLHIAKSIWAISKNKPIVPEAGAPVIERTAFLGKMYAEGTLAYDADVTAKAEINALNKIIYEKSDAETNAWYEKGKRWSMEHFELLYKRLGTSFDEVFFESDMAPIGKEIVKNNIGKIFEESEGAVVFPGEKYGVHTRVFLNSHGLPTYEAKELGLNTSKFKKYPDTDLSIVVTANEQNDYFKVLVKTLSLLDENIGKKTMHIGHGMLRLSTGKMSSRTGKVITAETLIDEIKSLVLEKMKDNKEHATNKDAIADMIAIGAIKYTILRQAIGSDVIFDSAKSISFEGDSGPYLQYSAVRAQAVLAKAKEEGVVMMTSDNMTGNSLPTQVTYLEKLLVRFPDIVSRARSEYAPQHISSYLIALAGEFNSFYARQTIVDKNDPLSLYYVALTKSFFETLTKGLWILGIGVPEKM
ncbi:MAG: arginine--tRNA ligase [Candidatus Paceibacterota bacterium]